MRVKKGVRIVAAWLAVMMVFSACAQQGEGKESTASKEQSEEFSAQAVQTENSAALEGNMYVSGLPIVKEKETFTIFVDGEYPMEPEDMALVKQFEAETNVHVEWMMYPYEAAMEKVRILLNSNDYPEVIAGWLLESKDVIKYGQKEGVFLPLEELFAAYAPNVERALDFGTTRRSMTLPDGHIYSPPYLEVEPQLCFGPWINQTWLDTLGLKMPTTTDELYDVLLAFRDGDPNGNGVKDEIPISAKSGSAGLGDFDQFAYWFSLFGAPATLCSIEGQLVYGPAEASYKEGIKYFTKLYKEGLLDPEIFTQDGTQYDSNCKNEDAIYGAAIAYDISELTPGRDPEDDTTYIRMKEYVPLPPLENGIGTTPRWNRQNESGMTLFKSMFVITDKAEHPEVIVRWLDHLFQTDNSIQAAWGIYGYTLQKNEDGTYEKIINERTLQPQYSDFPAGQMLRFIPSEEVSKYKLDAGDAYKRAQNDALDALWSPGNMTDVELSLWLSEEESDAVASSLVDIISYAKQKRAEWISGESDVETEWDAYIAHLNSLGLPKVMEVYGNVLKASK